MCLLIETIRVESRKLQNLAFHNERFNRSRRELFGITQESSLEDMVILPSGIPPGKIKCRIVYGREIMGITFSPYLMQKLLTLQIVEDNAINYAYKFRDRQQFEKLKRNITADDILIVRNGFITDTSYANVVFWDGLKWITPASPLLCGTMRSRLMQEGEIQCDALRASDLRSFKAVKIINAMIGLEESPLISIKNILR
jgi:4-amino-4-deoxychorismate lyase